MSKSKVGNALVTLLSKIWSHHKELRILVSGKTGQGKSTLVNGILGDTVAKEGAGAARCTTKVEVFSKTINHVPIKVFDSPGLQDRMGKEGEYIRGMTDTCQQLSLVLYCTKMINTRLTDDDKNAMKKLTVAFGDGFWNYAVLVLTFANKEDVTRKDDRDDPNDPEPDFKDKKGWKELGKRRFQHRLKVWEEELQRFLIEEVKVSPKIVQGIPVVPTGDHTPSRENRNPFRLPDRTDWFEDFWKACCLRVKETGLFLQVNSKRMLSPESKENEEEYVVDEQVDETLLPESNQQLSLKDEEERQNLGAAESFIAARKVFEQAARKHSIRKLRQGSEKQFKKSKANQRQVADDESLIKSKRQKPPVPPKPNRKEKGKTPVKLSKSNTSPVPLSSVALPQSAHKSTIEELSTLPEEAPLEKSSLLTEGSPTLPAEEPPLEESLTQPEETIILPEAPLEKSPTLLAEEPPLEESSTQPEEPIILPNNNEAPIEKSSTLPEEPPLEESSTQPEEPIILPNNNEAPLKKSSTLPEEPPLEESSTQPEEPSLEEPPTQSQEPPLEKSPTLPKEAPLMESPTLPEEPLLEKSSTLPILPEKAESSTLPEEPSLEESPTPPFLPVKSSEEVHSDSSDSESNSDSPDSSDSEFQVVLPRLPSGTSTRSTLSGRKININDEFFKVIAAEAVRKNMEDAEVSVEANEALKRVSSKGLRNWIRRFFQKKETVDNVN